MRWNECNFPIHLVANEWNILHDAATYNVHWSNKIFAVNLIINCAIIKNLFMFKFRQIGIVLKGFWKRKKNTDNNFTVNDKILPMINVTNVIIAL